jgi:WD40 repeat protein
MKGHVYGVYSIVLNQSNKQLFSGSADNTIGIWTCKSRKRERTLEGHGCTVTALVLSKNENFLFSLGSDNLLIVWNLKKYKMINRIDLFSSSNYSHSFALSDQYYTIFGRDKYNPAKLRILNLLSGETVKMVKVHTKAIRCVTVSPDDNFFFTGGSDNVVNVLRTENAELVHAITSNKAPVNDLAVSKDNRFLASASNDNAVRIFNCDDNYSLLHVFKHSAEVSALTFSKSHQKLVTGGWHFKPIKCWNTAFLGIDYNPSALETPGKYYLSKSPVNQKKTTGKSTGERMKEKVLNYAQSLDKMEDINIARKSLDNISNWKGKKGANNPQSKEKLNENINKLLKQNTGSIEELPDDEDGANAGRVKA